MAHQARTRPAWLYPSDPWSAYDQRATMRAWESFVTRSAPEAGSPPPVRSLIHDSWTRCATSAIDAQCREAPLDNSEDRVERLRRTNRELCSAARETFAQMGRLLVGTTTMLILTDRYGAIIETIGDQKTLEDGRRIHLEVGGVWNEGVVGTNGIGTALWTGEPVFVHAAEHFCFGIKPWSCAGAPIRDPFDDSVIGVVDLSGLLDIFRPHNTALVAIAARQIEGILARRQHEERTRLLEAFIDVAPASGRDDGIVILDRMGHVVYSRCVPDRAVIDGVERGIATGVKLLELSEGMSDADIIAALPAGLCPRDMSQLKIDGELRGAALIFPHQQAAPRSRVPPAAAGARRGAGDAPTAIVGESEPLREAIDVALRVALSNVSVLIEGETGVGKELFARLLHAGAARSALAPFVAVNCGAVSKELFGGELFGHVPGAFTGATREGRPGKLELADGGVLCLDEIGEMPLDIQPYLLRVLEEQTVYRIGDSRARRVSVRLIALTNRDLRGEVAAGRFRRDLYYRVGAVTIRVPPLRERGRDVALLIEHFNRQTAGETGQAPLRFSDPVMDALLKYRWPGNVRELKNLVQRLYLLAADPDVGLPNLPVEILEAGHEVEAGEPPAPHANSLDWTTRQAILEAAAAADGNMTRVARTLGISRPTLYRKLKLYGIQR